MCSKIAWEDFKTARWLRRYDPRRERGRAEWWLYVAWGLWKVGVLAFGVSIGIIAFVGARQANNGGGVPPERLIQSMIGAGIMLLVGLSLSSLATVLAVTLAYRYRTRLWLHGSVNREPAGRGLWPPYDNVPRQSNRIGALQLTAILSLLLIFLPLCVWLIFHFRLGGDWVPISISIGVWPTAWVWARASHLVTASSPAECWPPDELAALPDDPLQ